MVQNSEEITVQSYDFVAAVKECKSVCGATDLEPTTVAELKAIGNELGEVKGWLENSVCFNNRTKQHLLAVLDQVWHVVRWFGIDNLDADISRL